MPPRKSHGEAVAVEGLKELQAAFRRVDAATAAELRGELREIAKMARNRASSYVSHATGRHGDKSLPRLEDSIRVGLTAMGAVIYSNDPYAAVQDLGGRVGHGAVLQRSNVSRYMTRAVQDEQSNISARLDGLLATIGKEFEV